MEKGYVTPLLKKVTCNSLNDIRAITQTDVFSKLAESFMFDNLYKQVEGKINLNQFGSLKNSSTSHYLVQINHFILKSAEIPGTTVIVAGIDSFKAFDLVDHKILVDLLINYFGVNEIDVLWIVSFLRMRTQIVKNGKVLSDEEFLSCGTAAGTKLAALLFILVIDFVLQKLQAFFINNPNFCCAGFVDDIVLVERVINNRPKMQEALDCLASSCTEVKISPNPQKCEILLVNFGGRRIKYESKFFIHNVMVPVVQKIKILGVTITGSFKWDAHIQNIVGKANSKLFQLRKLFTAGFSINELVRAYCVYLRSNLEYCSVVWGPGLSIKLINKLERVQKRALSIINRKRVDRFNYEEVLELHKIESLESRRNTALEKFGFKLLIGRYNYFLPLFTDNQNLRSLRSQKDIIVQPYIKNSVYQNSTINAIINKINEEYKKSQTIYGYKLETIVNLRNPPLVE